MNIDDLETAGEEELPLKVKAPRAPKIPTDQELANHLPTHLPYRSWCRFCVMARAKVHPHTQVVDYQDIYDEAFENGERPEALPPRSEECFDLWKKAWAIYVTPETEESGSKHLKSQCMDFMSKCLLEAEPPRAAQRPGDCGQIVRRANIHSNACWRCGSEGMRGVPLLEGNAARLLLHLQELQGDLVVHGDAQDICRLGGCSLRLSTRGSK